MSTIKTTMAKSDATFRFKNNKSEPYFKGRDVWVDEDGLLVKAIVLTLTEDGRIKVKDAFEKELTVECFVA